MRHSVRRPSLIAAILLVLFVSGCIKIGPSRLAPRTRYHTLEYASPDLSGVPTSLVSLRVESFEAPPLLRSARMLFQEQPFRSDAYPYDRWTGSPSEMIGRLLVRDMRSSKRFGSVYYTENRGMCDYRLEGRIGEFTGSRDEAGPGATLEVAVTLSGPASGKESGRTVFQKIYKIREKSPAATPSDLAEAMSRAVMRLSGEMMRDIAATLAR